MPVDTATKALRINLDTTRYGTFAEIGAGQEVARFFFQAGGASKTIAKTMSAYDMVISDEIYGTSTNNRYVSKARLVDMLDHEYSLLIERLAHRRQTPTCFFAFADTVTTRSYREKSQGGSAQAGARESHGWMGMRFQREPGSEPADLILHVRMLDSSMTAQQNALGMLGVNVIHACCYLAHDFPAFLDSLFDGLPPHRIEIDYLSVRGKLFPGMSDLTLNWQLLANGYGKAFVAKANGDILPPCEVFHRKSVFSVRGSFYPFAKVHEDMIRSGVKQFSSEHSLDESQVACILELTSDRVRKKSDEPIPVQLERRIQSLHTLNYDVLVTNFQGYQDLVNFYRRYTEANIGLGIGIQNLARLFDVKRYQDKPGGILGAFGTIFNSRCQMYVYPRNARESVNTVVFDHPDIPRNLVHLFHYLCENDYLRNIQNYHPEHLDIFSSKLLESIASGSDAWQDYVPEKIVPLIKNGIF